MHSIPRPWLVLSLVALAALVFSGLSGCTSNSIYGKSLPTATTGNIRIAVSQTQYAAHDPVGVTITNASGQTYYAVTGRSGCTYLQMQEFDTAKNKWVSVFGCSNANPTSLAITPKLSAPFTLAPNSAGDQNAWDPGTYRVVLVYSANPDGSSTPLIAYSAVFTIVSG